MATAVIWGVKDNLLGLELKHYTSRRDAINFALGEQKALITIDPSRYWRVEAWETEGNLRTTVRSGPSANSSVISDVEVQRHELTVNP